MLRFVAALMFQEFPFHEEKRWPYNPGMAPGDGRSAQVPALDARHVVDAIPGLAWSSRPDGSVEFFNGRWYEYTGLSAEESLGWGWKAAVHGEDIARLLDRWATRDAEGGRECEVRLRRSDSDFQWFLLRHEPLCDPTGAVVRWYGTWINIEDSKQKELLGVAGKRALEMIADGASLSEILNELCCVIDVYASATSQVLLMDRAGHQLLPLAGPNFPPTVTAALAPWPVGPNRGCCGTAAFTGERVIISDMSTDPRWPQDDQGEAARRLVLDHGLRAAWSEPLISNSGEVLGTFCIGYSQPRTPTSLDLQLIEAAGHIARIAIERHQSQEALSTALEVIKDSETNLRRVIDTIPTLAWCNSPDGPNEFLNKRWHEYTGRSHEESTGWGWQAAFHPEDVPPMMKRWRELLASGESGEIEARLRRHDGVYRWFLIRVEPFHDERGQLLRWYGTSTDIDALKQTQEKLREDEQELRRITDAIPQAIVVLDPSGAPVYANYATLDYAGLTAADVVAPRFRERLFHSDDLERFRDERKAALCRGVPFEAELRARRKDGAYRWFLIRYNPFRNEQGQLTRWYATGTDIDDRVRAEERTRNENLALREQIDRDSMFEDIVGSSDALRKVLQRVSKVASSDSTILILGETGTGKELIARAIHKRSGRADRAFIGVNCAAIPPSLIASELFGHEKGAFTGAIQRRLGRFETANGGTVFLDEIGDLPGDIQIALLRVLQEREIERIGGNNSIPVDVRVLAATHRDLNALVAEGRFREDLLYRLNVVPIEVPPLRERVADIPLLVEYFIDRFGKRAGKKFKTIDQKSLRAFQSYVWPGNVRELQNVIERAVILSEGQTVAMDEAWLKRELRANPKRTGTLHATLVKQEKEML
ncbi:MAG TPA: sigma 54-interacting transcriptional regulator, partial [Bryobacteraceae bacterium]|nr:sigma 54-interacting transcriptional regulator [Bryobacteraceae bacterium]